MEILYHRGRATIHKTGHPVTKPINALARTLTPKEVAQHLELDPATIRIMIQDERITPPDLTICGVQVWTDNDSDAELLEGYKSTREISDEYEIGRRKLSRLARFGNFGVAPEFSGRLLIDTKHEGFKSMIQEYPRRESTTQHS